MGDLILGVAITTDREQFVRVSLAGVEQFWSLNLAKYNHKWSFENGKLKRNGEVPKKFEKNIQYLDSDYNTITYEEWLANVIPEEDD